LPLASITKLLTVYAASNVLQPNSVVTMTPFALAQNGNAADVGFRDGETFDFEDIARLTLAASSNVGAEAIADAADSAENTDTASFLSTAAQQAGLAQTQALNATGLDKSATVSGSYGSAHDVAVLAGELLKKDPQIAAATTQSSISITSLEGTRHRFANTDTHFTKYPGLLLSKTGYTDLAGGNLVIVIDAGTNHPVAIVVLGSTKNGRFTDVSQLMAATLAHFGGRERRLRRASQGRDEGQPPRDARRHRHRGVPPGAPGDRHSAIPFMPLGLLLPLLYRPISWKGVLGIAVAFSLCIETLQLVLRVGTFDVDDILLNTLGVMLGYFVFLLLTKWMRSGIMHRGHS
jgi:D-alanyl-D-alanine carboxypeptidase